MDSSFKHGRFVFITIVGQMKVDMENIASPTLTNTWFKKGIVNKGKIVGDSGISTHNSAYR